MIQSNAQKPYSLGIDLGVRSLGWAIIDLENGEPAGLRSTGVRCFEAGVEGNVERGKDQSRAAARRAPRQARRQIWRRAYRRRKVLRLLQKHGLFPAGDVSTPQLVHEYILTIDANLRARYLKPGDDIGQHTLQYRLRAKALDERLGLHELGRVFYHLAQRRGFETNRKAQRNEEDDGKVYAGITQLETAMANVNARTLGEYFSALDPAEQRIRQRWTSRNMYRAEFDQIYSEQANHHDELDDDFKAALSEVIFFQRPLKSQAHLIGRCSLLPTRRRAPQACCIAQEFRLLDKVNNLMLRTPGELDRMLPLEQRQQLIDALMSQGDLTFGNVRKLLKTKEKFNLEEGGEKKLVGNRTDTKLRPIFEMEWDNMSAPEHDDIIDTLLSIDDPAEVERLAKKLWNLNPDAARNLAEVKLEQDRASLSREAMRRLLNHMEHGVRYGEARKIEFPGSYREQDTHDLLPPVLKNLRDLRNPAVLRALSELRKVVNGAIRTFGKPAFVRIELARDLKNSRKKREDIWKKNRDNEKSRADAKARILRELPNVAGEPRASDIEKVLLADECNWTCPFTGKGITMAALVGRNPEFDVEHILPFSKTLDNTYPNKTLCYVDENRHRKRNRFPFEAYNGSPQYEQIINRVKSFKGNMQKAKLARFLQESLDDDFTDAQLQDTRYASRLAGEYLALLYGGRSDDAGTLRVQVSSGGATAYIRNEWQLNSVLNDGGPKTRTNHKHHAVDAIAIALTGPATVKKLSDAAERRFETGRRLFAPIPVPWNGFLDDVRRVIDTVNVSHRVNHKLSGALHKETNYSKPHHRKDAKGREIEIRHVRKPVASLSSSDVESIVDPRIRRCVEEKLAEVGDPKKLEGNWPMLPTRDGRSIPIKKVRTWETKAVVPVGSTYCPRYVAPGNNHHTVIVARKDKKGNVKWEDNPATLLDAVRRKNAGEPVIQREWDGAEFVMWFSGGDSLLISEDGKDCLYRCVTVSDGDNWFRRHDDARSIQDMKKDGDRPFRAGGDKLRQVNARKVKVSPLGEVTPADV